MNKDLWPDFETEKVVSPKSLLIEQANFLSEKTKKVIIAKVTSSKISKEIIHAFNIIAPALDNYSFNLFQIRHGIIYYPISFIFQRKNKQITNEQELIMEMERVFNSEYTKKIIRSLYSQSID